MIKFVFQIYFKCKDSLYNYYLKKECLSQKGSKFYSTASILNASGNINKIRIGERTIVRGEFFIYGHGGDIQVGDLCYIGEGTKIWSSDSIKIGNRVLIAHSVNIHDSNSHPMNTIERANHFNQILTVGHPKNLDSLKESPIIIEDDVWIGFNSTILKGVKISKGAIIAACSVVTKDVPPFTVVAGNPAKVVKYLNQGDNKIIDSDDLG